MFNLSRDYLKNAISICIYNLYILCHVQKHPSLASTQSVQFIQGLFKKYYLHLNQQSLCHVHKQPSLASTQSVQFIQGLFKKCYLYLYLQSLLFKHYLASCRRDSNPQQLFLHLINLLFYNESAFGMIDSFSWCSRSRLIGRRLMDINWIFIRTQNGDGSSSSSSYRFFDKITISLFKVGREWCALSTATLFASL